MDEKVDQLQIRLGKLKKIRELGTEPYPYSFEQSHTILKVIEQADELIENQQIITIAGRMLAVRGKGKASFCNIQSQHKRLQVYIRLDVVGESVFEMFKLL
jgi:Lysyl-tRNA synthetase (class II)